MDDDIFLACGGCGRAFYVMLFTEDEDGFANPLYCPFCRSNNLTELDDELDAALRPRLKLLQGGLASGDKSDRSQKGTANETGTDPSVEGR